MTRKPTYKELEKEVKQLKKKVVEYKLVDGALQESEEKYRNLVERANDGICIVQDEKLKYVNPRLVHILGYTIEELTGSPFVDYLVPEETPKVIDYYKRRMAGENVIPIYETTFKHKNGSIIDIEINAGITNYMSRPADFVFIRDIAQRKSLEGQFQQAQKMEAVGALAAGIAHDFNNLLMGMQGYDSLMLMDIDPTHPHYERLKGIEQLIQSGANLTRQLLGFARGGKYEVQPTDLNEIVRKSSAMFARTKKELTIRRKYQKDLWTVEIDRGQIGQVFLNLYINAWQAMPAGGELYIETQNVTLDEWYIKPYQVEPGRYVKISVTDTGVGMDEATRQRIFEPFFSTKEIGQGTGLGLASVYGIVKNHGGYINVYSEEGRGTTFTVYLPASEMEAGDQRPGTDKQPIHYGNETMLLVDDEQIVLEVAGGMLTSLGYTVMAATNGKEAIEVYEKEQDTIDLVILDMIMPGVSGSEACKRLKAIDPAVNILLSSGYSIDGQATEILKRGCNGFIQKPFDMKGLSRKIREILDA